MKRPFIPSPGAAFGAALASHASGVSAVKSGSDAWCDCSAALSAEIRRIHAQSAALTRRFQSTPVTLAQGGTGQGLAATALATP